MQNKNGKKLDIRKIILILAALAVVIGLATGKLSLSDISGQETRISGETENTSAEPVKSTEASETAESTSAEPAKSTEASETAASETASKEHYTEYRFRNRDRLDEHYEKHGKEMGFSSAADYQKAASDIINDQTVENKYKSDGSGDRCFYVEASREFVVLSNDGYIRTYFICSGIEYYNRQ